MAVKLLEGDAEELKYIHQKMETSDNSFPGRLGHVLEPIIQYAGFNWKVNVAFFWARLDGSDYDRISERKFVNHRKKVRKNE